MQVHVLFSVETQTELRPKSVVDGESNESIFLLRYEDLLVILYVWCWVWFFFPMSLQTFYYDCNTVFVLPFKLSITS